jgi:hydroxyacylglutathione hydrolase
MRPPWIVTLWRGGTVTQPARDRARAICNVLRAAAMPPGAWQLAAFVSPATKDDPGVYWHEGGCAAQAVSILKGDPGAQPIALLACSRWLLTFAALNLVRHMNTRTALFIGALVIAVMTACDAAPRGATVQSTSRLFAERWNSGLSRQEPVFQTQGIDADTFAIRQSINATFEAPFLYLIFGSDKALLIDTGVEGGELRSEVETLIEAWLARNRRQGISLVVMHSHGHGDHVGGDAQFAERGNTVVVGHSAADVARFFGIQAWPEGVGTFDLGGRVVDIVPTPGHHPAHVMVFDRATGILFSGDAIYPGRLYFQCEKSAEYLASIDRVARFVATREVRWLLGAHIEMRAAPGESFQSGERARHAEHLLELPPAIVPEIQQALTKMGEQRRVEVHDDFILFPHPADPRGKKPPGWCL